MIYERTGTKAATAATGASQRTSRKRVSVGETQAPPEPQAKPAGVRHKIIMNESTFMIIGIIADSKSVDPTDAGNICG